MVSDSAPIAARVRLDDVVAERREEERRRLSRGASHRQQRSGDDTTQGRRHDDLQGHPPARRAESQAGLPQGIGPARAVSVARRITGNMSTASAIDAESAEK